MAHMSGDKDAKALADAEADAFVKFRSIGIEEIKLKSMAEPEKFKANSVFIANKEQIEKA